MKTCKEIKNEYDGARDEIYKKFRTEIMEAQVREFPVGSNVRWNHGESIVRGVVLEHANGGDVLVKNSNTERKRTVPAGSLELDV